MCARVRLEEGDDVLVLRVEAPDAFDQHLINRTHLHSVAISRVSFRDFNGIQEALMSAKRLIVKRRSVQHRLEEKAGLENCFRACWKFWRMWGVSA
ncbi:hypothetical protein G2W53_039849 [Senna tora]|uniref:Uncharacterized protein n=1 Tax=Senna tora TaxID=362788 RepID=A0A834SR89_9FABA|nr:hypothetical protein G2W53_039849 [Senna tora]